jgi:hypothetical protein
VPVQNWQGSDRLSGASEGLGRLSLLTGGPPEGYNFEVLGILPVTFDGGWAEPPSGRSYPTSSEQSATRSHAPWRPGGSSRSRFEHPRIDSVQSIGDGLLRSARFSQGYASTIC